MRVVENRLIPLEAFRGMAALVVLLHHFFLGFSPYTTGVMADARNNGSIVGLPYFVVFNGGAAVTFFFTLSGFVLCWSYFNKEDPDKLRLAFLKRLPRLAGIVTLTTLVSYGLFKLGLYRFSEAAQLSHSAWLAKFASSGWTPGFEPSFAGALFQGLSTFFTGQYVYNSNLWTMSPEFFGSLLVFMLAGFIATILKYRLLGYAFVVLSLCCVILLPHALPFVAGAFLACWLARNTVSLSLAAAWAVMLVALYLLGYVIPEKSYAWAAHISVSGKNYFATALHTAGSGGIILATMASRKIYGKLNGKLFRLLGRLSFPLYLVHILVICSISSHVYFRMGTSGFDARVTLLATFVVTLLASLGAALPIMKMDEWWTGKVNHWAKRIVFGRQRDAGALQVSH